MRNFWPIGTTGHTDENDSDITRLFLPSLFEEYSQNLPIIIDSHFSKSSLPRKIIQRALSNAKKQQFIAHEYQLSLHKPIKGLYVWYTSENKRPPLNLSYDVFLSHDLDQYEKNNIYLPFWATKLGVNSYSADLKQIELSTSRVEKAIPSKFACAVISNPEPVRMEFLRQLSKLGIVDIYGKMGIPLRNKYEISQKYRFNICFENSQTPGYITEKPIEAWSMGAIPIWSGIDSGGYLNEDAHVNVSQLGFRSALEKIEKLECNYLSIQNMITQPILRKKYDYDDLRISIKKIINRKFQT